MPEELLHTHNKIKPKQSLVRHTTFRIGGYAQYLLEAKTTEDILNGIKIAKHLGLPYYILGAGSNILVSDHDFAGLVIKIATDRCAVDTHTITVDAGVSMGSLACKSADWNLTGFEWGIGVPGTVGGSVRGNAGAYGSEMKNVLYSVTVFRPSEDKILTLDATNCEFGYRHSIFKANKDVILSATLKLKPGNGEAAKLLIRDLIKKRNSSQGVGNVCAGCVFKNYQLSSEEVSSPILIKNIPPEFLEKSLIPAGWMIEMVGLKGFGVGGAKVSDKHGNFIINHNNATAKDIKNLIAIIKEKIKTHFGIDIQEEIAFL